MSSDSQNNLGLPKEVLGGIVTVNGFFTGAVFLSINSTITPRPGIPSNCTAGDDITLKLFLFQISSLVLYLLSSLIALAAKLVFVYFDTYEPDKVIVLQLEEQEEQVGSWRQGSTDRRHKNNVKMMARYVRRLMFSSVVFSAAGSLLMLLSMVNMVQIKLGLLSCGSMLVVITVLGIAVIILIGLVIYLVTSWFVLNTPRE